MRQRFVIFATLTLGLAACSSGAAGNNGTAPPEDTGTVDTGVVDSAKPDTATAIDSSTTDTAIDDTSSGDTATADTTTADTMVADTADTATTDTTTEDTADTATVDTGTDTGVDSADTCVASTEICNGVDDDCDGTVDNGCPASINVTTPESTLTGYGNVSGGTAASDTCPAGSALVGINVRTNAYLRQIQGICAPITVVENTSATPYTYTIGSGTETTLTVRGPNSGGSSTAKCPAGSFVVRVAARSGALVDQLTLGCAPLTIAGSPGSFTLSRGTITDLAAVGGSGGTAQAASTCTGTQVVNKLNVRTGDGLDYVQLACATPVVVAK